MPDNIKRPVNRKGEVRPIRSLPGWQVSARLRHHGIRQYDIAAAAKVAQSRVSEVINRRRRAGADVDLIWTTIEQTLAARERASA